MDEPIGAMENATDAAGDADGRGEGDYSTRSDETRAVESSYKEPEGSCHPLDDEQTLPRLEQNDPSVSGLNQLYSSSSHADTWGGRVVSAIGGSVHLKKLNFFFVDVGQRLREQLAALHQGLARNRTIEHLTIRCNRLTEIAGGEFFIPNKFIEEGNLRCIELNGRMVPAQKIGSFTSALSRCWGLQRISFDRTGFEDEHGESLFDALNGHKNLLELDISENRIRRKGFVALSNALKNPKSNIRSLSIRKNEIDDECIKILSEALVINEKVRSLKLSQNQISAAGACSLLAALSSRICSLEILDLAGNNIDDEVSALLRNFLSRNRMLVNLNLSESTSMTSAGWRAIVASLPGALEQLGISNCNIDDEVAMLIVRALLQNKTLKTLDMSNNRQISSPGWGECFNLMKQSAQFSLKMLSLSENNIDEESAAMLVEALAGGNITKGLCLDPSSSISMAGWRVFANALKDPNCKLENIFLDSIDDDAVVEYAGALANNTSLKIISFGFDETFTTRGWNALSRALCNTSSIADTFFSNHTLQAVWALNRSDDVEALLTMNENKCKFAVAREKILLNHFPAVSEDVSTFIRMGMELLPRAIEWIGRDGLGFSLMYHFVRGMPSLFEPDTKVAGKKRKRINVSK